MTKPPNLTLEYTLLLEDLQAFNLYCFKNSPTLRKQNLIGRVASAIIMTGTMFFSIYLLASLIPQKPSVVWFGIIAFVFGIGFFFYAPQILKNKMLENTEKLYNERDGGYKPQTCTVSFNEDGVEASSEIGESKVGWKSIDKIGIDEKHIYLYLTAVNAIIIPDHAFNDEESRNEFVDYVRRVHSESS